MGKEAFTKRKELLKGGLNRDIQKRMVKALIWSVTLYETETWTMRKEDVKRIEAFEMWIWRRMESFSWTEHRTNEEVLKKVEEKKIFNRYTCNQNKAEELDWTHSKRQLSTEGDNGGKDGGEERNAQTKAHGLDDGGRIRETQLT